MPGRASQMALYDGTLGYIVSLADMADYSTTQAWALGAFCYDR